MKMIRWNEDGVWHYMATNSRQMLQYMTELVGDFEYVERIS